MWGRPAFRCRKPRISRFLDAIIVWIGEASAWIWTALMLLIVYQVVQRYVFGLGSIKMEEMQWHLYGIGFMLAIPFAEIRERHVRIDVLAEHWPLRRRLWVEAFGLAVLSAAVLAVRRCIQSWPYVTHSYAINEISSAPDGLSYRYVFKAFIVSDLRAAGDGRGLAPVARARRPATQKI